MLAPNFNNLYVLLLSSYTCLAFPLSGPFALHKKITNPLQEKSIASSLGKRKSSAPLTKDDLLPRYKSTGNETNPTCFYNYGGNSQCHGGIPDWNNCDVSIDVVCKTLSTNLTATDTTPYHWSTGNATATDCYAQASNGNSGAVLDYGTCYNKFQALKGCSPSTNWDYDPNCVGGSINEHINDLYAGHKVDEKYPLFILGTSFAFGVKTPNSGIIPFPKSGGVEEASGKGPTAINSNTLPGLPAGAGGGRGSAMGGFGGSSPE